jgi:hypothetical protein
LTQKVYSLTLTARLWRGYGSGILTRLPRPTIVPDRRVPAHKPAWGLKKEMSIGDLVAIASAVVAVLYSYSALDKRITLLEASITTTHQQEQERRIELAGQFQSLREQMAAGNAASQVQITALFDRIRSIELGVARLNVDSMDRSSRK